MNAHPWLSAYPSRLLFELTQTLFEPACSGMAQTDSCPRKTERRCNLLEKRLSFYQMSAGYEEYRPFQQRHR